MCVCVYYGLENIRLPLPSTILKIRGSSQGFSSRYITYKKEMDWKTLEFLFQASITPMLLYECKIWGPSITENTWNELKGCRYWKQLATTFLRIKVSTLYEILLA